MSIAAFREAYAQSAANASFGEQQTSGLSAGQYTQYFNLTPRNGKPAVLGTILKFVGTLTATAAQTPVSGSDALDLFIGGGGTLEIAPSSGAATRAKTLTRQFAEFIYAVATNTNFSIAACPTFASAGTSTVTTYVFVPVGGEAAVIKAKLAGNITGAYAADVTIAYTSVTTYIVSSTFSGVTAFNEELTASLGTSYQSLMNYIPKTVAPDYVFMKGESDTTITQVSVATMDGAILVNTTDTDVLELAANSVAVSAGTTYTTALGFVIAGDQKAFQTFQVTFASATTHNIGYVQFAGGPDVQPGPTPSPKDAPAAVNQTGKVTASGGVAVAGAGSGSRVAAGRSRPP